MSKASLSLACLLIVFLSACAISVEPKTQEPLAVAPTETNNPEFEQTTPIPVTETLPAEPAPENTPVPESTATQTPLPPQDTATPQATPTSAPTQTPTPALPQITVNVNLNVRLGPGVGYERIAQLTAGDTLEIVGRNANSTWWQISYAQSPTGLAWIADGYGETENTENIPIVQAPPPPATPTPAEPTPTPVPTTPPIDFVVKSVRLWTNEENGGVSAEGSVVNCGYGHNLNILVVDPDGNPVDGVVFEDTYKTLRQITGSRGPGRAEYIFWSNGYQLSVVQYDPAGREVTSEISPLMSPKDEEIPISWLIGAHYCANEAECSERVSKNLLCRGHYSFDIVFQRTW